MGKMTKAQQQEQQEAIEKLRAIFPPGSKIYTKVTHVARSGMSRSIELYYVADGEICNCSWLVARALGDPIDQKNGGVKIGGCGMDMGFALANALSYKLHGLKDVGEEAEASGKRGVPFKPSPDKYRAGYSIKHEWI